MSSRTNTEISYLAADFSIDAIDNGNWAIATEVLVDRYWSGEKAPVGRQFNVRLLWSDTALYIYFEANQAETLVVSERANRSSKTDGLWERDVCEIFVAPDRTSPRGYFEFEIAPNGEWLDLAIDLTDSERKTDWKYRSGMQSCARIEETMVRMAAKIDWKAFGLAPKAGDVWLGNLFRCVGKDPNRGYLAWSPTGTELPNFHVPDKFGEFKFIR